MNRRRFLFGLAVAGTAVAWPAFWLRWARHQPEATRAREEGADGDVAFAPADVLLIRHAEEEDKGPHLNDRGRERANKLVTLFPARFPRPTALFAARSSKESERPFETLQPLAAALGQRINDRYADEHYRDLASEIFTNPAYAGGHLVICWHHVALPHLAAALRVPKPPAWPPTVYDRIWIVRYAGGKATLTEEGEHLLPGDK